MLVDTREQRLLDIEALDHGFEDPVGIADRREVFVERAGPDQRDGIGREERVRLQRACALQPVSGGVPRDVEQQDGQSRVGQVCRDLCAHDAGT